MSSRMLLVAVTFLGLMSTGFPAVAQETSAAPTPEGRIDLVKASFTSSKAMLREYEWVETVTLSLSGEEKVRQQYQCYYGAEGALQKVPVAADAKEDKKRGLRGKVKESKTEELESTLKSAVDLLKQYAALDPVKIQAAKDAGNISVSLPGGDGVVNLTIKNYLKPGDEVTVQIDSSKNTLKGLSVASFMEDKSPVSAKVVYAAFPDGTIYPSTEGLEISAQKLNVDVQNSGYRKLAK